MQCPHCGTQQPFEFSCVSCRADLKPALQDRRGSIWAYRVAVLILFSVLLLLLTQWPSRQTDSGPAETGEILEETTSEPGTESPRSESFQVRIPFSNPSRLPVIAYVDVRELTNYRILAGLRQGFGTNFEIRPPAALESGGVDTNVSIAIGPEAIQASKDLRGNPSLVLLDLAVNRPMLNPSERRAGIRSDLPPELELAVLMPLLEGRRSFLLVAEPGTPPLSAALLREMDVRVESISPDIASLERALSETPSGQGRAEPAVVWFYGLPPETVRALLGEEFMARVVSVSGIGINFSTEDDSDTSAASDEGSEAADFRPTLSLELRPEGLGRQGAELVRRLQSSEAIRETDLYPRTALTAVISLAAALDATGAESWISKTRAHAKRLGMESAVVP